MMNETEWVVYRLGGEHGFLDVATGTTWDNHVELMRTKGVPVSLTLLARGLTHKQAEQFVELTKESTE